jgi:hypothetical protein
MSYANQILLVGSRKDEPIAFGMNCNVSAHGNITADGAFLRECSVTSETGDITATTFGESCIVTADKGRVTATTQEPPSFDVGCRVRATSIIASQPPADRNVILSASVTGGFNVPEYRQRFLP